MSSNQSYQLPDLLNIISPLELRTNRHCRFATTASEQWITSTKELQTLISENQTELQAYLRSAKIGLLAAVCFPTCDAPQLRILTDFMTLLFFTSTLAPGGRGTGIISPATDYAIASPRGHLWELNSPSADSASPQDSHEEVIPDGIALLNTHVLLKHAFHSQFARLSGSASTSWKSQFTQSVESFRAAQLSQSEQLLSSSSSHSRAPNVQPPSVEEYLEMRRELYGSSMVFDIGEILQTFKVPELPEPSGADMLGSIKKAAFDVIAWSTRDVDMSTHWVLQDVVGYQNQTMAYDRAHFGNSSAGGGCLNLVALLMQHRNLSVQGAMNVCGGMIRTAFEQFCTAEKTIWDSLNPIKPSSSIQDHILSWVWNSSANTNNKNNADNSRGPGAQDAGSGPTEEELRAAVKRYIQALKDCIVGTVHWVYETELFFGKKGGEIRTFGWVFVDQSPAHVDGSTAV